MARLSSATPRLSFAFLRSSAVAEPPRPDLRGLARIARRSVLPAIAAGHLLLLGYFALAADDVFFVAATAGASGWGDGPTQTAVALFAMIATGIGLAVAAPGWPPARPLEGAALSQSEQSGRGAAHDLVAQLNHELRTPLNAVIGFAEAMHEEVLGPVGDQRYRDYARHIRDSGTRLLRVTEETLAVTSLMAEGLEGPTAAVRLADVLAGAERRLDAGAAACLSPAIARLDRTVVVQAHVHALEHALVRLMMVAHNRGGAHTTIAIDSRRGGSIVRLDLRTEVPLPSGDCEDGAAGQCSDDLAIRLSRALIERHGAALVETAMPGGSWQVSVLMPAARPR